MKLQRNLLIVGVFSVLFVFNLTSNVIGSSDNEASLALNEAEELLAATFEVVSMAESNGVEVSGLSGLLKDATQLLAQAYNSYRVGDFDKVINFANLASEIGNEVKDTAQSLKEIKSDSSNKEKQDSLIESAIIVIVVLIMNLLCWSIFKKFYYGRKHEMKPEVTPFES